MILAIDPSLSNTAVVRGDAVTYEVATFSSERTGDSASHRIERYQILVAKVADWLGDIKPEAIFLEGYSFDSTGRGIFSAEYGGLLRAHLLQLTHRVWEIAPNTLKKYAGGIGKGNKDRVIARLRARYHVSFATNDEFDAFGLFKLGLMVLGQIDPLDTPQAEVLHQLRNPVTRKAKAHAKRVRKAREKRLF